MSQTTKENRWIGRVIVLVVIVAAVVSYFALTEEAPTPERVEKTIQHQAL